MPYNSNGSDTGIPIPRNADEMIRVFPQLVSVIRTLQSRISTLENKIRSLETIGGNVNQL